MSMKNIDNGKKSLKVGHSKDGHPLRMRVDGITIVSMVDSKREKNTIRDWVKNIMGMTEPYSVEPVYHKKNGKNHYQKGVKISSGSTMLVRIDYKPYRDNVGNIRFEFRPQHLTENGMNKLILWLAESGLADLIFTIFKRAWVTRLDVALDVYNCTLEDYFFGLKRCYTGNMNLEGDSRGLTLGTVYSHLQMSIYEKTDLFGVESSIEKVETLGKNILRVDEYADFLRIEARIRPKNTPHSKQANRAIRLADLDKLVYPFESLQIYHKGLDNMLHGTDNRFSYKKGHTLARNKHDFLKRIGARKMPKHQEKVFKQYEYELLNKGEVWSFWPDCKAKLGLLGNPPLWVATNRNRYFS
ncbi:hypothetical protein LVQ79_06915 [Buttiauxella sp. A2-C1_F]|uniref:hypothetical protein n=1 Tax=Buttiauxella sp. A2-C1_F TaxID=2904526 RepID=UPI001E40ACBD|nr:hypothetical protein [Buttiauxella sp. A2-C1_F]MCE0845281.1 hypothetical protein [Buttiauxella sp. A2-C1_F]